VTLISVPEQLLPLQTMLFFCVEDLMCSILHLTPLYLFCSCDPRFFCSFKCECIVDKIQCSFVGNKLQQIYHHPTFLHRGFGTREFRLVVDLLACECGISGARWSDHLHFARVGFNQGKMGGCAERQKFDRKLIPILLE